MILVTGAAGFIGSNLVARLNDAGRDDIIVCDWLETDGRWENLAKRCFHDIVRPDALMERLRGRQGDGVDTVLHMGAISDTTARDGDLVIARNYTFAKALWDWCAANDAILVYASSAATYGDGSAGFDDEGDLAAFKRLRPLNLYGWSKHIFDLFALSAGATAPSRWYGLKFFNVFGPNEYHKAGMRSIICKLAPDILAGRPAQLYQSHRPDVSDGGQLRDFIYVDDVCAAIGHFATGRAASGVYNVGTGTARTFADLVSAAYRAAGHAPAIEYVPMPDALRPRYQYFTQAETAKLRKSGFDCAFQPLETGVERYVRNYLQREDRFR